jgi:hypothetical protein
MPVIDFEDLDQYGAVIAFLAGRGTAFHTRPPQQIVVGPADYKALQDAEIVPDLAAKANGSRGKKTRSVLKTQSWRCSLTSRQVICGCRAWPAPNCLGHGGRVLRLPQGRTQSDRPARSDLGRTCRCLADARYERETPTVIGSIGCA